ncbi:MAG: hypothetical protein NZ761_02765 [Dehalococcoidia bacterium]|nr:hypothetical protein [Dehalococcoidia bacterium]MCX7623448.1 hypothetical protein [Thermomicrobium sp.]
MSQPLRPSHLIKPKTGPDDPELQETLLEGLQQVAPQDVAAIASELVERRQALLPTLATIAAGTAPEECRTLAAALTATAKQAREAARILESGCCAGAFVPLLAEDLPVEDRLERFLALGLTGDRRLALELATGLLHLAVPRRYWLWTRWLWDVDHRTGLLPLLASSTHAIAGEDPARDYRRLGALIALGAELGRNSGLLPGELADDPERGPFATDAFLAVAYSVYLYGITNWRLSREFNRLLPPLPDLARRLLGLPRARQAQA